LRIFLSLLGTLLFIVIAKFGYCLLIQGKLSGTEFVSLIIAFAVIGLILSFASEVQEFSVAGNIVKLKEVKREAEKSISELKSARTETFRFLLSLAKRHALGSSEMLVVDARLNDFWSLYDKIVAFNCDKELSNNLVEVISVLLQGQLRSISHYSDYVASQNVPPKPSQLTIEALDNDSVARVADRGIAGGDHQKIKQMLAEGLEEYRKLYELREKYEIRV
jgi:hypothetical protein